MLSESGNLINELIACKLNVMAKPVHMPMGLCVCSELHHSVLTANVLTDDTIYVGLRILNESRSRGLWVLIQYTRLTPNLFVADL